MSSDLETASDIAISVRDVSKKFKLFDSKTARLAEALHPLRRQLHREFWAVRGVSFNVRRGEIIGILGKNGSGKSTLLQIICAVMRPTTGQVVTTGRISALLELGAGFNPEFTGRENVLLNGAIMGFSRQEMQKRLPAIEAFAEIGDFFDQPVKTYSSGMFVRVAFAAAINIDPDILVVDEALSVGDSKFQHRCFQRIRAFMEQGKTIIVVSHSTDTLLRLCHRGIVMDSGEMTFIGPIAEAVNLYQNLLFGAAAGQRDEWERPDAQVLAEPAISAAAPALWRQAAADARDMVAAKPHYNAHETRLGNRAVSIIDFDIIANDVPNPPEIPAQARTEVIIKLRFNTDLRNVSVGFAVVTVDGTYIFGTNLFMMERKLIDGIAGAQYAVRFSFISRLAGGDYFLNLGCDQFIDGSNFFLDVRRSVAKLSFAYTPGITGFVNLAAVPEVIELTAPEPASSQAA
jgi:lipopolysaccharide transport system ATP-binding protein